MAPRAAFRSSGRTPDWRQEALGLPSAPTMTTETRWQPGQVLLDKYRVDHELGVGGMGAVIAATHLQLDQRVALKFVHADIAKHPEAVQRFIREARAAAQIRSEHVVRVSDVGKLEDGS